MSTAALEVAAIGSVNSGTVRVNSTNIDIIDVDASDVDDNIVNVVDVIDVDTISANAPDADCTDSNVHDPFPDVHALFASYNKKYFKSQLNNVYVEFSTRMTLCAGTCTYRGAVGGCRIALSEPLLKFRPSSDLCSTLLHEMIHAYLFNRGISRDGPDGHGPIFMEFAHKINSSEPPSIRVTPYHSFAAEVDHYRIHHWKCERCAMLIKRAMNRPPGPYDSFWAKHITKCGGFFVKISGPTKPKSTSGSKLRVVALSQNKTRETLSSLPFKTIPTHRIDEMLAQKPKRYNPKLVCPACNQSVAEHSINNHLDTCLTKYSNHNSVPNKSGARAETLTDLPKINQSQLEHKLGPPAPHMSSTFRKTGTADKEKSGSVRGNYSGIERLQHSNNATLSQELLSYESDTLAMLAFKPQSFSPPQSKHVFTNHSQSYNPSSKKRKTSFKQLLSPLFLGESPTEQEQLAKDIADRSRLISLQDDNFPPDKLNLTRDMSNQPIHSDALKRSKTDCCPICNKIVPRAQLSSHINVCMEQAGLKKEFCDSDQEAPITSALQNNSITPEDKSNCPVCDVVVSRQSLERHVSQCMTSMGLRDAF